MKQLFYIACLLLSVPCLAQWHDNNWIVGGINQPPFEFMDANLFTFDSNELKVTTCNFSLNLALTKLIVSDIAGNLIFYSNGLKLYDNEDSLILNGDTLNASPLVYDVIGCEECGYNLPKSIIALSFESDSLFCLLHLSGSTWASLEVPNLMASVVDMSLNNGKGAVTSKNQLLFSVPYRLGIPAATKHANGRDWWALIPEEHDSVYYRILVTHNGVESVEQQVINDMKVPPLELFNAGQNVFSPDGTKYVGYGLEYGLRIFDFDRCTGLLGNLVEIPFPTFVDSMPSFGVAIAPNSRYLYASSPNVIIQFDLWASDIAASADTVAVWDGSVDPVGVPSFFYDMLSGPDGKIYIGTPSFYSRVIHVINYPNKKGSACDVRQRYIQLPNLKDGDFPIFPNYRLGPFNGSSCDTLGLDSHPLAGFRCEALPGEPLLIEFTDNSYYGPATWTWDFGDGAVSQDTSPVHAFPGPGSYLVCLTVSNQFGEDTWCKQVNITVSGTKENSDVKLMDISPNPVSGEAKIYLHGTVPSAALTIYTATGQPALTQPLQAGWSVVPLEGLAPGLYFYEVRDEQRLLGSGKLVRVE